jgi:NADPH:quinone reductase-like Zn-dependent oxidoreductase
VDALTPGEVVIKVRYSSINYKDALAATGAGKILRKYPLAAGQRAGLKPQQRSG